MAYDKNLFDPTSNGVAGKPKMGSYGPTADAWAAIEGAGYFNKIAQYMGNGDLLHVSSTDGSLSARLYFVAVNNGVVTITNVNADLEARVAALEV